jgi:hypothetical protein
VYCVLWLVVGMCCSYPCQLLLRASAETAGVIGGLIGLIVVIKVSLSKE